MSALRLMIYDRTWEHRYRVQQAGLTSSWIVGAALYRGLGRLDRSRGVTSWREAVDWLASFSPSDRIGEIQFWGHGRWGRVLVGDDVLDASAVEPTHALYNGLSRVRDRMDPSALWWFRTCETFGMDEGHAFATTWTRFFHTRAAGHTYVIGPWQSGLHTLAPGASPTWSAREGLPDGEDKPSYALMSHRTAPNTITCLHGAVPVGF